MNTYSQKMQNTQRCAKNSMNTAKRLAALFIQVLFTMSALEGGENTMQQQTGDGFVTWLDLSIDGQRGTDCPSYFIVGNRRLQGWELPRSDNA